MKLTATTVREVPDDGIVQVNVDLKLGEETGLEFAVVFDTQAYDVTDVSWWGFRTEGGCNQLMHENWGAPLPEGEMYEYVVAKARSKGCSRFWHNGIPELALETWSVCPSPQGQKIGWTLDESKNTDLVLFTFDSADTDRYYILPFHHLRMAMARDRWRWVTELGLRVERQYTPSPSGGWSSECVFVPITVIQRTMQEVSIGRNDDSIGEAA